MRGKDAPAFLLAGKHDRCVIAGDGRGSGRLWPGTDTCHQTAHANTGKHYSHPSGPYANAQGKRPAAGSGHEHMPRLHYLPVLPRQNPEDARWC